MTEAVTLQDYVVPELIFLNESFTSQNEFFEKIYDKAFSLGYVREDFLERIKAREATFPTGLQLEDMGVAIPHTDAECVLKEFVAVVTTSPVGFKSMEDINQDVSVEIAFVLGLNEPHSQLEMLQSLMGLLQNKEILSELKQAKTSEEVIQLVKTNHL
ncbi:PTS transporter subunit EIIA [Streptococcus pneumoniae]|nr:PTS transporter subunit EIIA [Streptococcus pneumoniae]